MSRREFARAAVLARVEAGEVTLRAAVAQLDVSYRQAKRLWRRYRERGRAGLVHGNLGRRSNRAAPAAYRERVLALIREQYSGPAARRPGQRFGPTLVAEHLWTDHGLLITVPTVRRWMQAAGLWSRGRKPTRRQARRAAAATASE